MDKRVLAATATATANRKGKMKNGKWEMGK